MENLHHINRSITKTTLVIWLILSGCELNNKCDCHQYGIKFNKEREKWGLVQLDSTWRLKESSNEISHLCLWSKPELLGYSRKKIELSLEGDIKKENDEYYLGYSSIMDLDDISEQQVYKYLSYDFKSKKWTSGEWGEIKYTPNYDINTSLLDRDIDFLHFVHKIPWNHLPKVDTTIFPLPTD